MDKKDDIGPADNCQHCDFRSVALEYPLSETDGFRVVCDVHPITAGHILIIPKEHISCLGAYPDQLYREFLTLYRKFTSFILQAYGSVSTFEHGKTGQTVFHSHIHVFPFTGPETEIIPEGKAYFKEITDIDGIRLFYRSLGAYLFFSIGDRKWLADISLGYPGFFRDRFARALKHPEKGNWKEMQKNKPLMTEAEKDIREIIAGYHKYSGSLSG
ncbi:hypothetical protein A2Z33_05680 [Candidatus Gottesmanbacteria bacterium RBG_16_52_11]|uniref:HIT domain-containing protein n=1 Tax=Candidatus Gottesmanbacteria bacterium RBG_16_52_11 TaxID=1798374 RepID=A0A1F5YXH5_9BACT|nr:MAG: hypothetical protein A2Z33_05680 [Candidatus Gottesmanbacteria bacterium RBG_16_52_11]